VHVEYRADEAAAIHAFGRCAGPEVGYAREGLCRGCDGGGIVPQRGAPLCFGLGIREGDVALAAVGIFYFVEAALAPFEKQAVSGHNVRYRRRIVARLCVHESVV